MAGAAVPVASRTFVTRALDAPEELYAPVRTCIISVQWNT